VPQIAVPHLRLLQESKQMEELVQRKDKKEGGGLE